MNRESGGRKRRYWLAGKREDGQDRFFREALDPELWEPGDSENWDACWYTGMPNPEVFSQLTPRKWVNHIPGNSGLTIKSKLAETLFRNRERLRAEEGPDGERAARMQFFPDTYPMPEAYHLLQDAAHAEPDAMWILKPKNSSRGRDISLVQDIAAVPTGDKWMVQRYLHEPHLMNGHKYVMRLYVLITSVEPLRVYLFEEGFAKLASEPYDLDTPDNIFSHLTNPDVNATNVGSDAPVVFIPLSEYRSWLREQSEDDAKLVSDLQDLVTLTVISVRETMRRRVRKTGADASGCYELLGLDCLVDRSLKPWILECNLSPSLDICCAPKDGGDKEFVIKRQLVHDMVGMLGFNRPWIDRADMDPAARIVAETDEELAHSGGWRRLYPREGRSDYLSFFAMPRLADIVSADNVAGAAVARPRLRPHRCAEIVGEDRLAVFAEEPATLYRLNQTAAWIWLNAVDGAEPDAIAAQLVEHSQASDPKDLWSVRKMVWDQIADWVGFGMLRKDLGAAEPVPDRDSPFHTSWRSIRRHEGAALDVSAFTILTGGRRVKIEVSGPEVRERLAPLLTGVAVDPVHGSARDAAAETIRLQVFESPAGYSLAVGRDLVATDIPLSAVAPILCSELFGAAVQDDDVAVLSVPVVAVQRTESERPAVVLLVPARQETGGAEAAALAHMLDGAFCAGAKIASGGDGNVVPMGLPVGASGEAIDTLAAGELVAAQAPAVENLQVWPAGRRGRFIPPTMPVNLAPFDDPPPVEAIVVLSPADAERGGQLQPAAGDDVLAALMPHLHGPGGRQVDAGRVAALLRWLEQRSLWSCALDGDPWRAAEVIAERLNAGTPNAGSVGEARAAVF